MRRGSASYYFSTFPHCWGWATWRRAWALYDPEMECLPLIVENGILCGLVGKDEGAWIDAFRRVKSGDVDSWAYRWLLSCWSQGGLTATPNLNLVTNIGFDARATHTSGPSPMSALPSENLGQLNHPMLISRNCVADNFVLKNIFNDKEIAGKVAIRRNLALKLQSFLRKLVTFAGSFKPIS